METGADLLRFFLYYLPGRGAGCKMFKNNVKEALTFLMYKALFSAAVFVIMAILIRIPAVQSFDVSVIQALESVRHPVLTAVFKALTELGSSGFMLPLNLVLAVYKKAAASLYLYLLFFVERTANEALKGWIARERPAINPLVHEPSYSFPSGHSMNAASMYPFIAFLLLLCIPFFQKHSRAVYVWTGLLVGLIGISRMYLGVHYMTDVISGFSLGLALFFIFKKIGEKYPLVRQK
ncbi:phosphatase PAP2 family protein [Bacillus licheniformis]|nr:phosphatase PAP2 family protein [Bacillus licheniformis]